MLFQGWTSRNALILITLSLIYIFLTIVLVATKLVWCLFFLRKTNPFWLPSSDFLNSHPLGYGNHKSDLFFSEVMCLFLKYNLICVLKINTRGGLKQNKVRKSTISLIYTSHRAALFFFFPFLWVRVQNTFLDAAKSFRCLRISLLNVPGTALRVETRSLLLRRPTGNPSPRVCIWGPQHADPWVLRNL